MGKSGCASTAAKSPLDRGFALSRALEARVRMALSPFRHRCCWDIRRRRSGAAPADSIRAGAAPAHEAPPSHAPAAMEMRGRSAAPALPCEARHAPTPNEHRAGRLLRSAPDACGAQQHACHPLRRLSVRRPRAPCSALQSRAHRATCAAPCAWRQRRTTQAARSLRAIHRVPFANALCEALVRNGGASNLAEALPTSEVRHARSAMAPRNPGTPAATRTPMTQWGTLGRASQLLEDLRSGPAAACGQSIDLQHDRRGNHPSLPKRCVVFVKCWTLGKTCAQPELNLTFG